MEVSTPTTFTCTLSYSTSNARHHPTTLLIQPNPTKAIPVKPATPPNLLTEHDIRFIQFLLSGYDEPPQRIPLSTGLSECSNPRFLNFVTLCTTDDNFRKIADRSVKDYTQKIKCYSGITGVNPLISSLQYLQLILAATKGSPLMRLQNDIIEPLEIFTSSDIASVLWQIRYIALLYDEDLAKAGYQRYSNFLKTSGQSKITTALTTYEKHLPILAREYPNFGIALKAKIQNCLIAIPEMYRTFTIWQAQLPPAARS